MVGLCLNTKRDLASDSVITGSHGLLPKGHNDCVYKLLSERVGFRFTCPPGVTPMFPQPSFPRQKIDIQINSFFPLHDRVMLTEGQGIS